MTDHRHTEAVCDFVAERLVNVHGGRPDQGPPDPGLPPDMRIVTIGDAAFYVSTDPGEPTSGRGPDPEVVLLSSCAGVDIDDTGAAEAVVHAFRNDPTLPSDLRVSTTIGVGMQVWLDRRLPAATSFEVVIASLDEFVTHALRLRTAIAPLDCTTSEEAMIRAGSGMHSGSLSYDLIESAEWNDHPWLSRIETRSDIDGDRHYCLFGLSGGAARLFAHVTLEFELENGLWQSVRPQIPGSPMPSRSWETPSVAWFDPTQWGRIPGRPDNATGRYRARIPTGWVGPPV